MNGDAIDEYLAELRAGLRIAPARTAEILAEAEDHLRESAAAAQRAGRLSEPAAQRAAIEAFGPAKQVVRAHRPPVTAFAAAAGLKALPLLAAYVVLSAVVGVLLLWSEGSRSLAKVTTTVGDPKGGPRKVTMFELVGTPHPAQAAAVFGGCVLAAVLLTVGFLIARRRGRRTGLALVRLPRGLLPVAAAIVLLGFGLVFVYQIMRNSDLAWLPGLTGSYELLRGGSYMAVLTGVGCALWALGDVVGDPVGEEYALSAPRPKPSAYAAEAGLKAGQLLGGYLLISATMGGILLDLDFAGSPGSIGESWEVTASFGGCILAGVLLVAGFAAVRQRRRAAPMPRWLSLLISSIVLLTLAVAEYAFFVGDVMGTLLAPEGIGDLILGSQWAVVLIGSGWVLRILTFPVRRITGRQRASGRQAPTEGGDLAPIG